MTDRLSVVGGTVLPTIRIQRLPGRIVLIGNTKFTEEFFHTIDEADPANVYRLVRVNGVTQFQLVGHIEKVQA